MCLQAFCTCCCCCLPTLSFTKCFHASTPISIKNSSLHEQTTEALKCKIVKGKRCKKLPLERSSATSVQHRNPWPKWVFWGTHWLLLNHLWFCVLSLAIPLQPPNNSNNINAYRSSKQTLYPMTTAKSLNINGIDNVSTRSIKSNFINLTKKPFSNLNSVPTKVVSSMTNSNWTASSSSSLSSSPSLDNASQQSLYKQGQSLRPVQPIPSPPPPPPPSSSDILSQPPRDENVSLSTALVPKTNWSSETEPRQKEVTTVGFHHSLKTADSSGDTGNDDDPARTTVLEIIDHSPLILNLPISSLLAAHLDPIVKRMLEKGTDGGQSTTGVMLNNTGNATADSSEVEDHLIRAGRQTHHDFIKRILNAVSVDSHNVNRYVHLVRPKGGRPQGSGLDQGVTDLGLPPEIADEYIDGVNPPKFPGLKTFHPLIEKNDWRGPLKQSKPKKPGPLVTVVDPDKEQPNLYSKPTNRPSSTFGNNKPKHFYPENSLGPMQPVIKLDSQQHHLKLQPVPRPPQYPLPKIPPSTIGQHEDNLSLNNRNVLKTKLSVLPLAQPSQDNAKHDLSLLLKQEFDAKNAELNQTKAQPMAISPAGQVLSPPPGSGSKHFTQLNAEKRNKTTSTTVQPTSSVNPLSGPPYQLPVELMNTSLTTSSANNVDMKEGVHYKTVSSLVLPPELTSTTSTTTSTTTEKSTDKTRTAFTKLPKIKTKHKEVAPVTDKNTFVRIRTGVRRPRPKTTTTTTTTTTESPLDNSDDNDVSTPSSAPTLSSSSPSSSNKLPSITSPKFVSTISNDVRFQVESSNRLNFTQYKPPPPLSPLLPPPPPHLPENLNELELNSDESRVLFNTSLNHVDIANSNMQNISSTVDDSVSIVPTRPQSTGYRLTTERLAYILIGTCCGLAVLVLIIVAMSVRCKDMCSEYRSWKSAEKAALRWHRHNRHNRQRGGGLTASSALPYPMLSRSRFNLPRYFRTSIDNAKLRPPPLEPYSGGNVGGNDPFSDKVLGSILQSGNAEGSGNGGGEENTGPGACCHCIDCSSTWFFRNDKHGGWCCQRGYYQPPRRTKLPFGAASSVNTFMPRFAVDHNGDIKTNHHHLLQHMDLASATEESGGSHEPVMGRLHRNASEPNLDMCFSELNDSNGDHGLGRTGFNGRLHREKANSSGAIPVMSNRFFDGTGNHHHQSSRCHRNKEPLFCEMDDDEEDDDDEVNTDFSNVFETNFGEAFSKLPRKSKAAPKSHCNRAGQPNSSSSALYNQKCSVGPPKKHKSDQAGAPEKVRQQRRQNAHQHHHHHRHHQSLQPEYYNPTTGKYYFDSTSIAKPLGAVERNGGLNATNGESSTIWISSSKLVDKLHQKHQASRKGGGGGGERNGHGHRGGGEGSGGGGHHRRGHNNGPNRPITPGVAGSGGDSSEGGHQVRRTTHHHRSVHQQQQQQQQQQRLSAQLPQCHTYFDPGLFARLGLPSKLTGNEHNFVVWNDTSERLI